MNLESQQVCSTHYQTALEAAGKTTFEAGKVPLVFEPYFGEYSLAELFLFSTLIIVLNLSLLQFVQIICTALIHCCEENKHKKDQTHLKAFYFCLYCSEARFKE